MGLYACRFQADCDAILEASLEAAWNLADNSTLSQGVRAWAAFSVGAFCAALLDRDDDVKSGPKRVPTYARHLVRLVETATGETETCCGGLMGLGAMIGGVTLPCRELDEAGEYITSVINTFSRSLCAMKRPVNSDNSFCPVVQASS